MLSEAICLINLSTVGSCCFGLGIFGTLILLLFTVCVKGILGVGVTITLKMFEENRNYYILNKKKLYILYIFLMNILVIFQLPFIRRIHSQQDFQLSLAKRYISLVLVQSLFGKRKQILDTNNTLNRKKNILKMR